MAGKIIAEIWLDLVPKNGGPGSGPGNGADDGGASNTTSQGLNDGVIIDQEGGGITFLGAGSIKGGKTDYDVGQGFWLGFDTSDQYYKVAIGDPNGDTFNWDGEEINSKMNNLELRGWLRGPAEFVIDPAAHGDETGEVVIAGDMEIQGSTLQVPNDFTIDPATHGDDTGNLIIAGNLEVAGGTITGPATIVIDPAAVGANSGLVQILGDLQVDGLTTTINSSVMTVDDKNVVIGEGATNAAAVNLGGFTLEGANATILYTASDDKWNLNKGLNITGDLEATGDITAGGALEGQSLDIGSGSLTVNSGGDLVTQGSLTVAGVSSLDGHVELGDSSTDLITFNGLVNSHIIPQTHNLYDLGSTNLRWRTLYVEDIFADTIDVGDGDFAVDTDGNVDANSIDLGFAAIDENGNATFATLTLGSATQGYILKQVNAPTSALSFVNHTTMELNNVASTAPTNATVLKYNSTNSQYESVDFKTTSLEDVSTTTATDNQILKYNLANTQYEPVDHNTRQLEDVSNTAPTNDQILQYNSATSKYEPEDFILDTLTDVTIADLANGDLLVYQSATSDWRNKTKTGAGFHDIAMSGDWSDLENTPTSLAGYGITDAYTKAQVYTKTEVDGLLYTDGDVDAHLNRSTAGTDEILSWNGTDYEWVTYSEIVGSVEELTDLSDVSLSSPNVRTTNDVLMWNGTYWTDQQMTWSVLSGKPSTVAGFNITDFDTRIDSHLNQGNASTDQLLSWNGTDYEWVDGGSNTSLADLTDVIGTPGTGSILVWDATGSLKWEAATLSYFSLSELGDVATTSPSTNQVLLWNGSAWAPGTISGNSTSLSLNNLTDVSLGTLNTNDYLKWDGSAWVDSVIDWTHIANKPTILTTADLYTDSDVDAHLNRSSAATNQVLTWNGTDYSWTTPATSNVSVLNDLSDVAAGAPSSGQLLQYNGTNWVAYTLSVSFSSLTNKPTTIAGYGITDAFDGAFSSLTGVPGFAEDLGDLGDVTLSTLVDGHILKYESSTSLWKNVLNNLNALSDVSISGPSANQVLSYNSTTQKWQNGAFNIGSLANVNSNADSPSNTSNSTLGASPAVLWYNSSSSEWNASPLELDDLYGVPDPAAASAGVGYVLAIKTLTHPQEYEWVSPNTSTSSLVPATTNTYDIGSSTKVWRDLHLGRYIELGNITISNNSGTLEVDGSPLATQTYVGTEVSTAITNLIDSAPAALDTLNELAAALGDDPNFATTVSTSLGNKLNISDFSSTADAWIVNKTTDDLGEGSTNLYHSTERVQDVVGGQFVTNGTHTGISFTYDDATDGAIDATVSLSAFNSDNLTEGSTNLYFTEARARAALSVSTAAASGGGSLSYANTTGVFTYTPPDLSSTLTTSSSIADLSDVDSLVTSGASNKDVLWYNTTSGKWENTAPANIASAISLSNLSDVSGTAATGGQVLTWNGTNSEWEAVTPYGSSNFDTNFASKSTTDLSEGSNLYYTDARVQTKLGAVSGSIIPNANETYDLGSSTYKFRDLYLSGNTLTLGTLSISDSSGALSVTSGGSPAKFSSVGITDNATSTAITIDSSQNVLVGTTDTPLTLISASTGDGIGMAGTDGYISISRDFDGAALYLNKTNNAGGQLIQFREDGTNIGSIGIEGGDSLYIQGGTTAGAGLLCHGGAGKILPVRNGASIDATIDLGQDSRRFKDFYIAGDIAHKDAADNARLLYDKSENLLGNQGTNGSFYSIYLGGTAAANRMDDYEEGTWTPSPNYGTVSAIDCIYTKIGNTVHVSGALATFSDYTTTEDIIISGLPFTSAGSSTAIGAVMYRDVSLSTIADLTAYVGSSSSNVRFYSSRNDGAGWALLQYNNFDSGLGDLYFSITYRV